MIRLGEITAQLNKLVFSIQLIGLKKCEPTWYHAQREHPMHSLWFILKGKGDFIIDGKHYPVEPGKLFFFTPGMICERKTDPNEPLEYYFIRFSFAKSFKEKENWYFEEGKDVTFPLQGMYTVQNPPQVINLLEQIHHLWKRRGAATAMRRKLIFLELLLTIVQDFRSQRAAGNSTMAIELTIDYMVNHYSESITLEDLAKLVGLSTSHYSRLFKKIVGYSPIDYLTHLRMDRAKELIVLSDYRLKAISQSVGYQDEFYFSRIFKKVVGVSPTEFAKRHRAKTKKMS